MNTGEVSQFATQIDLSKQLRGTMSMMLNQQLANTLGLYCQVKQAHWNVKGMHFMQLHLLFDQPAATLIDYGDLLAERVTALGGMALGTARIAATQSQLPEFPVEIVMDKQVVDMLAQRYGLYGLYIRAAGSNPRDDQVTADIFTEIVCTTDKHLWLLEAHLQD